MDLLQRAEGENKGLNKANTEQKDIMVTIYLFIYLYISNLYLSI
jgi:hypothetical protein